MDRLKKTPLLSRHQKYGGKIVDFGGWALPVQYTGIIEEHRAVRTRAGLFDVSHMGEIRASGPEALALVNYLVTNDMTGMATNQIRYSPMCYPDGGVVDDLLVYKVGEEEYLLVVNAANKDKDLEWIEKWAADFDVEVVDASDETAQLALQGPRSEAILSRLVDADLADMKYFWFLPQVKVAGCETLVSRTGYTGEDGFEIYCAPADAEDLWEAIMEAGREDGLVPVGLGARDTLRFEAALTLYGQELGPDINPLEAGLKYFVKLDGDDFIGRDALVSARERGVDKTLVGFEMLDRGIPRTNYVIYDEEGDEAGYVTSGSYGPALEKNIGLGFVRPQLARPGTSLQIGVRNRKLEAVVVRTPFYTREG
ncbi:MAG: glycine cleavage system aminomethyltransferase GcvT [Bacillota bacterium]